MALKTDYKDDIFESGVSQRRYVMSTNSDDTVSFEDITRYEQVGDEFTASIINETNLEVNNITSNIQQCEKDVVADEKSIAETATNIKTTKEAYLAKNGYLVSKTFAVVAEYNVLYSMDIPIIQDETSIDVSLDGYKPITAMLKYVRDDRVQVTGLYVDSYASCYVTVYATEENVSTTVYILVLYTKEG